MSSAGDQLEHEFDVADVDRIREDDRLVRLEENISGAPFYRSCSNESERESSMIP